MVTASPWPGWPSPSHWPAASSTSTCGRGSEGCASPWLPSRLPALHLTPKLSLRLLFYLKQKIKLFNLRVCLWLLPSFLLLGPWLLTPDRSLIGTAPITSSAFRTSNSSLSNLGHRSPRSWRPFPFHRPQDPSPPGARLRIPPSLDIQVLLGKNQASGFPAVPPWPRVSLSQPSRMCVLF